ncbi:MAG TPA: acetyl/propionyl/methylcrotonyl-CoA carboxylase subunit alpha [Anaeromyxobacter sp.]|nr:acetyl/propionyl/methylcrotonyl-CoA carboxylase subunit alpha [Anaeromyxobacter sp.]
MFDKVLIANRGEIACRVARTCRRLGIRTVAVHSEADAGAKHVREADEAVLVGPAPARESYLRAERILAAARETGAEAIHPGYGFLSENAEFAESCARAGVAFVGPPAAAIRAMGDKSAAKALMERAGVPTTPGYHGDDQDPARLAAEARRIGYPVLVKASAGGGGKGMRRVDRPEDLDAALASCRREAKQAFGDDRVLLERWVVRPRHVEIQVFADGRGGCVHLFERDCSVQRRHQKVVEEAPAPGLSPALRTAMGAAAVEAARAVGYVGAGTVEFLLDPSGKFFFMEMNTRLQVEHPVTELITGLDLVEWQLRVAAGEPLPLRQDEVRARGHAIEARIYAEDPDREFLPSTGTLVAAAFPPPSPHVRVDSGVDAGDAITPFYDPMIAKLVAWDETRELALARLRAALGEVRVAGVANNVDFLSRLVATPSFAKADLDTALIERERERLFPARRETPREVFFVAALAELLREAPLRVGAPPSPWDARDGWRLGFRATRTISFRAGDEERDVAVEYGAAGYVLALEGDAERVAASGVLGGGGELRARLGDRALRAFVVAAGERRHVFLEGRSWILAREDAAHRRRVDEDRHHRLAAPMPGKVIALLAEPGRAVAKGSALLVLEAMKMEHTLRAPSDGVVKAFRYGPGDQVVEGEMLVEFEAGPAPAAVGG